MGINSLKTSRRFLAAGFGLVELIVSISIMVLITSVILAKHDSFNGASLLRGQAYRIALQAREIQLFAISATQTEVGNNNFRSVYGLYFNTAVSGSYRIFRDTNNNGLPDTGEDFGKQGVLDKRFRIVAIRLMRGAVISSQPTAVAVSFKRPNFDARLFTSTGQVADTVSGVEIDIAVISTGDVRTVEITKTGQISVK